MADSVFQYVPGRPHPALDGLVLDYSGYREHSDAPHRRRQAPTGSATLILSLDPPLRLHGPAGPVVRRSFLAGMHDAVVHTEYTGAQAGVQVDLTPLGAHVLLGRPASDLTNRIPPLDELGVGELAALPARLADAPGWSERFSQVDAALLRLQQASRTRPDREVAWAWQQLLLTDGRSSVNDLAAAVGWSRRRLLSRFQAQIGLGPKAAARVLRFRRAADLLTAPGHGPHPHGRPVPGDRSYGGHLHRGIADIAAAAGYADHSHLVRDFHALAGCTPSEYAAAERADPGFPFVQSPPGAEVLPSVP